MAHKCKHCDTKIKKNFSYCPNCGHNTKEKMPTNDYGLLGASDTEIPPMEGIALPFGMERIVNSLVKQLEKQMNNLDVDQNGIPRGLKIRVTQGRTTPEEQERNKKQQPHTPKITEEERNRRSTLPRVDAQSRIKRLADRIIYELETPGVTSKKDVSVTRLASGFEIKVYSKNTCYVKFIPLTVDVLTYSLKKDKVILELRT